MDENYIISILGRQIVDGEENEVSVTTLGSYVKRNHKRFIVYKEYDSQRSCKPITSILKVEGNDKVILTKKGAQTSRLILESNKRHICHYDTGFGALMIGIFTNKINCDLSDDGGQLDIVYSLDINSTLTSINEIHINIKEKNNKDV